MPDVITVEVSSRDGRRLTCGRELGTHAGFPDVPPHGRGDAIEREDPWPTEADYGQPVLLPGGKIGSPLMVERRLPLEWRWQLEFCNSRR